MTDRKSGRWLSRPWPATHALILFFVLTHLAVAATLPLAAHEAHYALYGLYLDWSYIDHPPLVGWLQALALSVGTTELVLRIVPIALGTLSLYLLAGLALRLYPGESPWLGFISVLLVQGAIATHFGIGMAPDVALLPAGLLVFWFTQAILAHGRWLDWLGLGLALGLAGLAKYTAITLALSVLLALLLSGRARWLSQPRLWLAAALAVMTVSPVLFWNWQHDWASFNFQLGYQLDRDTDANGWSLTGALIMQLQQLGAYSPALYLGGIAAIVWSLRRLDHGSRLVLVFALPVLLLFGWLAGLGRSSPHWTYAGWVFLAPLTGRWIIHGWQQRAVRGLVYLSATYSILLLLVLHLIALPALPFPDYQHPLRGFAGWPETAAEAESLRQAMAVESLDQPPVLLVRNWHHASPLAWYARPTPVLDIRRRRSQFMLWFGEPQPDTRGILVIPGRGDKIPDHPTPGFECTPLKDLAVHRGASLVKRFYFYRCTASG